MRAIFEREFLTFVQKKRFFWLRASIVSLQLIFLLIALFVSGFASPDEQGSAIFVGTIYPLLIISAFMAPAMLAHVLAEEKRNNKLEVLRSSPISLFSIIAGKWSSRFLLIVMVVLAALPLTASSLLFGGVAPAQFFLALVVIFCTLLWVGTLSFCIGSFSSDPAAALRLSYGLVVVFVFGSLVFEQLLLWRLLIFGPRDSWVFAAIHDILTLNPITQLGVVIHGRLPTSSPLLGTMNPLLIYAFGSIAFSLILALLCLRALGRGPVPQASGVGIKKATGRQVHKSGKYSHHHLWLWQRPMLWFEITRGSGRRGKILPRALLFLLVIFGEVLFCLRFFYLDPMSLPGDEPMVHHLAILGFLFMAFLMTASLGAATFHRDNEARTLEVLHAAPLTSRTIARAKMLGTLYSAKPWWLLSMLHVLFAVLLGEYTWDVMVYFGIVSAILLLSLAAFAMQMSLNSSNISRASLLVLGIFLAHIFLTPVLAIVGIGGELFVVALLVGHHPLLIASLPFTLSEDPDPTFLAQFLWAPVLYMFGYLVCALHMIFNSIPDVYEEKRRGNWAPLARQAPRGPS